MPPDPAQEDISAAHRVIDAMAPIAAEMTSLAKTVTETQVTIKHIEQNGQKRTEEIDSIHQSVTETQSIMREGFSKLSESLKTGINESNLSSQQHKNDIKNLGEKYDALKDKHDEFVRTMNARAWKIGIGIISALLLALVSLFMMLMKSNHEDTHKTTTKQTRTHDTSANSLLCVSVPHFLRDAKKR